MPEREEEILKRYKQKLQPYTDEETAEVSEEFSREYTVFREEALSSQTTRYENLCNSIEKIIQIRPPPLKYSQLQEAIDVAHLSITPVGAATFAIFTSLLLIFSGKSTPSLSAIMGGEIILGALHLSHFLCKKSSTEIEVSARRGRIPS